MIYEDADIIRTRNPVLLNMIEGFPHNLSYLPKVDSKECWINGSGITGRLYLTYLVKLMFNIQRQPFCEEKFNTYINYNTAKEFFTHIDELIIDNSMQELKRLYLHTQKVLNSDRSAAYFKENKIGGMLKLKRGVGLNYAHAIIAHAMYAEKHGYDSIPVPTWILSGYAFSKAYVRDVEFSVYVPIEDILISSRTVSFSGTPDNLTTTDEEFIVINKNPSGIIDVKVDDIKFDYIYQEHKLKNLIDSIGLYSYQYFENTYPKPNILHEFYPTNIKEPIGVRFAKKIYDLIEKYKVK